MNIIITHVYSKANKGDAAILSVLISELNRVFISPSLIISTLEQIPRSELFDGCPQITSFSSLALLGTTGKTQKLWALLYVFCTSIIWAVAVRGSTIQLDFMLSDSLKELLHTFSSADLIVPVGGGYFRGKNNLEENSNVVLLVLPLLVGRILQKPVVLYSQSIGPFGNAFQVRVAAFALKHVTGILIREEYSLKTIHAMGIPESQIFRTVDAGFLFTTKRKFLLKELHINLNRDHKILVGITVRKWLSPSAQHVYEKAISGFADYLIREKGCSVVFISQVTADLFFDDDRSVAANIVTQMQETKHVWNLKENYSHSDIKAIYANLDYLIGTRLHSVILSLTSDVPCIAIAYEHKTTGVFDDLDLSSWVLPIESVSYSRLCALFIKLTNSRQQYLKTLHTMLPNYQKRAKQAADTIHDLYLREKGVRAA